MRRFQTYCTEHASHYASPFQQQIISPCRSISHTLALAAPQRSTRSPKQKKIVPRTAATSKTPRLKGKCSKAGMSQMLRLLGHDRAPTSVKKPSLLGYVVLYRNGKFPIRGKVQLEPPVSKKLVHSLNVGSRSNVVRVLSPKDIPLLPSPVEVKRKKSHKLQRKVLQEVRPKSSETNSPTKKNSKTRNNRGVEQLTQAREQFPRAKLPETHAGDAEPGFPELDTTRLAERDARISMRMLMSQHFRTASRPAKEELALRKQKLELLCKPLRERESLKSLRNEEMRLADRAWNTPTQYSLEFDKRVSPAGDVPVPTTTALQSAPAFDDEAIDHAERRDASASLVPNGELYVEDDVEHPPRWRT